MRFLIDESTGKRLATLLEKKGHDVVFVGDFMPKATDESVLAEAEKQNRILITDDKDFGALIFRLNRPTTGVILLRTVSSRPNVRLEIIKNLLKSYNPKGKFVVLKEDSIRIRKI